METVEILGMKVNVVPDTFYKNGCDICVFSNDIDRCDAHNNILGKDCFIYDFHFEKSEEEQQ